MTVDFGKFTSSVRTLLIIFLAIGISSIITIRADNPSPNGWNLSGGGFCQGTYTIFNTTATPNPGLYAENCSNGKNDCYSTTDLGALMNSCVLPNMQPVGGPGGGLIHMRAGFFAVVTPIVMGSCGNGVSGVGICDLGITFEGSGGAHANGLGPPSITNATVLVAKTNGMTMLKSTASPNWISAGSGSSDLQRVMIQSMTFFGNGLAAVGIDFRMQELASLNDFRGLFFTNIGGTASGFTTAMILDGNEDTHVQDSYFDGAGTTATRGATTDLSWHTSFGNVNVRNTFFGGITNVNTCSQQVSIQQSTLSTIKFDSNCATQGTADISDTYFNGNGGTGGATIQTTGATIQDLIFTGDTMFTSSTDTMFGGTGAINNVAWYGCTFTFSGTSTWNPGPATLTQQISVGANPPGTGATTPGTNHVRQGSAPTGFPFTITSSNF